jgi:hypothetical protein
MFFIDLLFALVVALVVSSVFAFGFRRRGIWPRFWLLFLVILLFTWAGGIWIHPIGPTIKGVFWVPFLLIALLIALFLAVAIPPSLNRSRTSESPDLRKARRSEVNAFLGVFFWILMMILITSIVVRYVT